MLLVTPTLHTLPFLSINDTVLCMLFWDAVSHKQDNLDKNNSLGNYSVVTTPNIEITGECFFGKERFKIEVLDVPSYRLKLLKCRVVQEYIIKYSLRFRKKYIYCFTEWN